MAQPTIKLRNLLPQARHMPDKHLGIDRLCQVFV
jgi:hypothetical protein